MSSSWASIACARTCDAVCANGTYGTGTSCTTGVSVGSASVARSGVGDGVVSSWRADSASRGIGCGGIGTSRATNAKIAIEVGTGGTFSWSVNFEGVGCSGASIGDFDGIDATSADGEGGSVACYNGVCRVPPCDFVGRCSARNSERNGTRCEPGGMNNVVGGRNSNSRNTDSNGTICGTTVYSNSNIVGSSSKSGNGGGGSNGSTERISPQVGGSSSRERGSSSASQRRARCICARNDGLGELAKFEETASGSQVLGDHASRFGHSSG